MRVYQNIAELVGNTPLLELNCYREKHKLNARLLAKLEYFNPAGSVKDRIAKQMLLAAKESGRLEKGGLIIEPTSGNTGIGLAAIAAASGYQLILTMPETMSIERRNLLKAYGAELVLTDGKRGMRGAIERAEELHKEYPEAYLPRQFENPENPRAHYLTTAREIWADTDGTVDCFVAGVGTGGTVSGVGKFLKEKNPAIRVFAVEPKESPVLSEGQAGAHGIQGIGAGFVPHNFDKNVVDEVIAVSTQEAMERAREVAKEEGVLVGISSGAALAAALYLAQKSEYQGKTIVALFPDSGDRYFSTPLFQSES